VIHQAVVVATWQHADADTARERVAGLSLLKRTVLTLARGGIRQVLVGARADAGFADDPDFAAANVTVEVLADARTPSAVVVAARERGFAQLLVATCERVVDPQIIRTAAAADLARADAYVAVAAGTTALAVRADGDAFLALGDPGPNTRAFVGVCALGPAALAAFRADHDVDAALATLTGRVRVLDVGDAVWHDVSTPAARVTAERAMFRALKKRVDGPISRAINRRVSIAITKQLVDTNVTPNQMTVVATIVGAAGVILTFQATWLALALGAFLVQMQSILDGCDGELARLKFKSSRFGEWLDNVLDDQVNVGYGVGLGYAASVLLDNPLWLWLGAGAGAAFIIHNLIFYAQLAFVHRSGNPFNFRWWFEQGTQDVTAMLQTTGVVAKLGAFVRALVRRDVFLFAFFLLAAARLPQVAVTWYALVAASQFGLITLHVIMGGPWKFRQRA